MRKFTLLLVALLATINVMATTVTFDFSAQGYANAQVVASGTIDANISWTASTGTNPPAYYDTGTGLRVYNGGSFVVIPSNGKIITGITLTFAGATYTFNTADANPTVWTGSTASSQSFSVTRTCRLQSVEVVYQDPASNEAATPSILPASGQFTAPVTVSITSATEDAVIYYTTDGTTPNETSTLYTAPFEVSTTMTVKAIATKETFTNSSVATATYTFPTEVANIAAFLALPLDTWAKFTGDITAVYHNGQNLYVQDESGYLLVYGNIPGENTTPNGTIIQGASAKLGSYGQMPQAVNPISSDATVQGDPVEPTTIAWGDITTADHARYVKIENVQFSSDFTFGTTNTTHKNDTTAAGQIFRNNFNLTEGVSVLAAKTYDVTGFVSYYGATGQPVSLNLYFTKIEEHPTVGISNEFENGLKIYSHAGNIIVEKAQAGQTIEVFNALGQKLISTKATNFAVPAKGVVLVKVGENVAKVIL